MKTHQELKQDFFKELTELIKPYFENINPAHDFNHTKRVLNNAIEIAKKEGGDIEIIKTAALLHDIARKIQDQTNGKVCHAEKGAEIAKEILEKTNFPKEKIKAVTHCIETHRFRNNKTPETIEAKIICDADNLDAIGAIGIARAISFAGHLGAIVHHPNKEELLNSKEYSKLDCAYREYLVKLSKIKDKMLTLSGKEIAEKRSKFMEDFFNRLNNEVKGIE